MIKSGQKKRRYGSLYLGLFTNIILAIAAGVIVYLMSLGLSNRYINNDYLNPINQQQRREDYLTDLQNFVTSRGLTFDDTDRISEWARMHRYVYLLVQKDDQLLYPSDPEEDKTEEENKDPDEEQNPDDGTQDEEGGEGADDGTDKPDDNIDGGTEDGSEGDSENNKENDKTGSGNDSPGIGIGGISDSRPSREELIAQAQANGLHEIELIDGTLFVSLTEFTQTLYYEVSRIVSLALAALALALVLLNYFRIIIKRIKKLEKDVNIVSHENMNHTIVGKGSDEIAALSSNVEVMRNTMLKNIQKEQEAREANTDLITAISHDIRTPLTVLMGYLEMMKNHEGNDETMQRYVSATESTAQRLKQLSDDMFRYSLAFGNTEKGITLEEYDAPTLMEQIFAEHILLLNEGGFEVITHRVGEPVKVGSTVLTDAQNLMRIVDNVFSNLSKYADPREPITIKIERIENELLVECKNKIREDTTGAESNGIGLKTCVRLASLIANRFEYKKNGDYFICLLSLKIRGAD